MVTSLAIIQLTAEERIWLGADVTWAFEPTGYSATGQVVALAPKQLARGWEQEPLL
jgi:hypothetical protein